MTRILFFTVLLVLMYPKVYTQSLVPESLQLINNRGCATTLPDESWNTWFNAKVEERASQVSKSQANYVIPVIVHVIYGSTNTAIGTYPNISQNQINSQLNVLNADFSGTGLNVNQLAATAFSAVGASNCNISFCLAMLDPQGQTLAEPGIHRVSYLANGWTNPASPSSINAFMSLMNSTIKPATIWDPTRYLNIWVSDVNINTGILGYATFPPGSGLPGLSGVGSTSNDGVWVWARSFGSTGTLQSPYNKGRTASHEIGHWLGLRHIGGDGNNNVNGDCAATDFCNDTPPQKGGFAGGQYGQNYGAPTYPCHAGVCAPNGDMYMNFMDYVDDPSCYMFTPDQRLRMQTAMANSPLRINLTASSNSLCNLAPVAPQAAFSITNESCVDTLVGILNQSSGIPGPSFVWNVQPSNGVQFLPSNTVANPSIITSQPGFYTLTLIASNSSGTNQTTQTWDVYDCGNFESVYEHLNAQISVFPNPSHVRCSIALQTGKDFEVKVYNTFGQMVYTSDSQLTELDIETQNWPCGLYVITLKTGGYTINKPIVVYHPE